MADDAGFLLAEAVNVTNKLTVELAKSPIVQACTPEGYKRSIVLLLDGEHSGAKLCSIMNLLERSA